MVPVKLVLVQLELPDLLRLLALIQESVHLVHRIGTEHPLVASKVLKAL